MLELHGLRRCPFFWRTRIAAHEKGVPFEWIAFDAQTPDPRSAAHNPEKKSPLMFHDGFSLAESSAIALYIDECFEGPALQPKDVKERAHMRATAMALGGIKIHGKAELTDEARAKAEAGLRLMNAELERHEWLGGASPGIADFELWPWFPLLAAKGVLSTQLLSSVPRVAKYQERVLKRPSFSETAADRGPA